MLVETSGVSDGIAPGCSIVGVGSKRAYAVPAEWFHAAGLGGRVVAQLPSLQSQLLICFSLFAWSSWKEGAGVCGWVAGPLADRSAGEPRCASPRLQCPRRCPSGKSCSIAGYKRVWEWTCSSLLRLDEARHGGGGIPCGAGDGVRDQRLRCLSLTQSRSLVPPHRGGIGKVPFQTGLAAWTLRVGTWIRGSNGIQSNGFVSGRLPLSRRIKEPVPAPVRCHAVAGVELQEHVFGMRLKIPIVRSASTTTPSVGPERQRLRPLNRPTSDRNGCRIIGRDSLTATRTLPAERDGQLVSQPSLTMEGEVSCGSIVLDCAGRTRRRGYRKWDARDDARNQITSKQAMLGEVCMRKIRYNANATQSRPSSIMYTRLAAAPS